MSLLKIKTSISWEALIFFPEIFLKPLDTSQNISYSNNVIIFYRGTNFYKQ